MGSWVTRRTRAVAQQVALAEPGRELTYAQLDELSVRLAHGLRGRGVGRGNRVAYLGLNSIDLVICMLATAKLGAVFVPLNTRLAPPELAAILDDADPTLLLHTEDFSDTVPVTAMPVVMLQVDDGTSLRALMADDSTPVDESIELDDLFMIQYTSGTSGRPKGVQLSHGNIVWNVYNLFADVDVCMDEVALVTAPLFHTAALNQVLFPTLFKGGTVLIEPRFDPVRALHLIETRRVTMLFGVTSMYLAIENAAGFEQADLSSLRSALTGGAPVPGTVLRRWTARGAPLTQGYGLTETSPGATMLRGADGPAKLGSAGPAVFFTDVRVVALDGSQAATDEPGEVEITGPNVTSGYWRNDQATSDAFTADGWLRTGDMAAVDADEFVRIVDRVKDMFISGGENVYPAEVEQAIHSHPAVAECAVIGVPDERWGEVGRAIVAVRDGETLTELDLLAHLDGRLARYKIPKTVIVVDEIPHNASGKVLKTTLRKEFS